MTLTTGALSGLLRASSDPSLPPSPLRASTAKGPGVAFAFFLEGPCLFFASKVLNTHFAQIVWDVGFQPSPPRPSPLPALFLA